MADISPYTFNDLRTPKDRPTNKAAIYQDLIDQGYTSVISWEDGSVPSALVETEAGAVTNYQQATQNVLYSGFNLWATGDALTEHSRQIYANERAPGKRAILRVQLTDTGAGPFPSIDPASISVSVGKGGRLYDGIPNPVDPAAGNVSLALNGSAYMYVQAEEEGSVYNVSTGTVDTMARGPLPGVTVTNPADALSAPGTVQGASGEEDPRIRVRNVSQWPTLGRGTPLPAYRKMAMDSDVTITKAETFRNVDILDPGCITLVIAGDAGAVSPSVVLAAQNAIASGQVGGDKIPETARVVVTSAVNRVVSVSGTVYLPGEYNNTPFRAQVIANVAAFQKALRIGGKVSAKRVIEVVTYVAGLDPNVILTVSDDFLPARDLTVRYYEAVIFDLTGLRYVSV